MQWSPNTTVSTSSRSAAIESDWLTVLPGMNQPTYIFYTRKNAGKAAQRQAGRQGKGWQGREFGERFPVTPNFLTRLACLTACSMSSHLGSARMYLHIVKRFLSGSRAAGCVCVCVCFSIGRVLWEEHQLSSVRASNGDSGSTNGSSVNRSTYRV